MKNYLLLLTLIFFSVGLFSQQFCGRDSVVVIEEIIVLNDATKNKARTDIATLAFEATPNTKYAVDQYKEVYAKVTEYFLKYRLTDDDMIASAKFMIPGASDEIFVRITENKSLNPDKVRFVTENGKEYKGVYNGKDGWTLTVLGSDANDGQSLYVVQEEEPDKFATLAKLNIFSYEPKSIKVALVPVNGFTNGFTKASVEQQLNAIYNKVGITCQVEIKDSFDYEPLKTKTFDVTGSGFFSTLTADMKAINNAYMQSSGYKEDVITLFIIEKVTGNENIAGDMPRGKQFGYLFKGSTSQTVAHEIGHGIFHLDHPFARANAARSFGKGELDGNVMEYPPYMGDLFVKLQWDAMHSPGLVIGLFERDEDAMQKATPGQLQSALKYYREFKLDQETAKFKNIPSSFINSQVKERLNSYGEPIKQGDFFLCGPAAACYIAAYHDPEKYVKVIFDLYMYGEANDGKIKGNDAIYDGKSDSGGNIDGIPAVDWILLHCLRTSENLINWGGYDPHVKDDVTKMSTRGELEDLIKRLGVPVSIEDQGSIKNASWLKDKVIPWLTDTKVLVFFVDSRKYKGGTYEDFLSKLVSQNYGRHFITVHKISLLENGSVSVEFWDSGKLGQKKTFDSFEEFKSATFKYWLIKNDYEK